MTTYGEPRVWLDQFPLNEPQPFAQEWHGLLYPGEIIRADSWASQWGEPLTGDITSESFCWRAHPPALHRKLKIPASPYVCPAAAFTANGTG